MSKISDNEILKHMWKGEIPLVFNLAPTDITSLETPHPYYELIPRMSYLSLQIDSIREHFSEYIAKFDKGEIWFDHLGNLLKWELPVGVLFDLYNFKRRKKEKTSEKKEEKKEGENKQEEKKESNDVFNNVVMPWEITVHFLGFPSQKLTKIQSEKDVNSNFMNQLKQGLYLKYADTKTIMTLPSQDQKRFWESIKTGNLSIFEEVKEVVDSGKRRVYPIKMCELRKEQKVKVSLKCLGVDVVKGKTLKDFKSENGLEGYTIIVHGIKPIDSTDMEWLLNVCEYPDSHNYFVLVKN